MDPLKYNGDTSSSTDALGQPSGIGVDLNSYSEPVGGPHVTVTDQFTGQQVAVNKNSSKDTQEPAVDGFSDQQVASLDQKYLASKAPEPVNLPYVTDEFTDQPAVGPCHTNMIMDTAALPVGNTSATEIEDPSSEMLTDSANSGHKTFQSEIYYLQPPAVWAHADVGLVSSDGRRFKVNAALLASASPHLGNILKSLPDGEDAVISTELCADKLKLFIEFVTTGTLSVKSLDPVLDDFACLGVDLLKGYKFQMSYNATSDPFKAAYLAEEESEKKVVVPSVSGVLRKPRILLIPKSQLLTITTTVTPVPVPTKKRKLVGKTSKDGTAKKKKVDGMRSSDTFGHFFMCTQPNCKRFFKDSTDFYQHKMKCNPKIFESALSSVKTNPRQARRERRERKKEEKAVPESREPILETCDDISIEYDTFKDEDINKEAMEMSTVQKSKNTLEVSSSATIAANYCVKKETNADGNCNSQKEKKQEGNSSTIMCSTPNCLKILQDAWEYRTHMINCPPRKYPYKKRKPSHKKNESPFKSSVGDINKEVMEMSTVQKSKNTLEVSSSATIAANYCVKKETNADGNCNSQKEKKQEGNSSTIMCSTPNCLKILQDAWEYRAHMVNCPPRKCKPSQKKYVSPFKSVVGDCRSTVCSVCGMKLASWQGLQKHLESFHAENKSLKCPQCPKMFGSERLVDDHIKSVHSTYICDLCGRSIKTIKEKDHMILFHTPEDQKPFQCKICIPVKGFLHKANLDDHMNIHTGKKPFKCTSCPGVAYANNANLSAHIRSVHKGIKRKPKNSSISK